MSVLLEPSTFEIIDNIQDKGLSAVIQPAIGGHASPVPAASEVRGQAPTVPDSWHLNARQNAVVDSFESAPVSLQRRCSAISHQKNGLWNLDVTVSHAELQGMQVNSYAGVPITTSTDTTIRQA